MGQEVGGGRWEKFLGKEVPPHFMNLNPVFDGLVPVCFIDGSNNPYYREVGETGDSWQSSEFPTLESSHPPGCDLWPGCGSPGRGEGRLP